MALVKFLTTLAPPTLLKKLTVPFRSSKRPSLKNKEGTLIMFSETKNIKKAKRNLPIVRSLRFRS
jgi:hypothetical protein